MPRYHEPVLKETVLQYLIAKEEGMIVDGTCGDGGHTRDILEHTGPGLRVLALDRDEAALQRARGRLKKFGHRVRFVHANFSHLRQVLRDQGLSQIDGLLLDLGVSSLQ
nr:16S rRNA (cytosine(1402)-N(4))-methyltransferase [Nitrospinaceae bacterium]NIR55484.1 16S rRNA (cytosine(1402)-N(4))-methyltransferase [Nitrospinaceae bacterium]NIS85924.1 16S rRNA (cytosine(1402)-N(4))-methyltransferase [Nitrospinaceae bacterium]NIT82772.1 16S rRNA (cytosine(1402)-N(4))-methyltransferase [Nitrospinaceae bacterium]NIU44977.1 16S rRNA (cytosine(1402)-N(4))-methyltransferase [Nitrospinaceae bacterium]